MNNKDKRVTFGQFLQDRRKELKISMRKFADIAGMHLSYLSVIEYGTKPPPENEMLDNLIKALQLSKEGERRAYDLAAKERGKYAIAQDATNYIRENPYLVQVLRIAEDAEAGKKEWERFVEEMEARKKNKQ